MKYTSCALMVSFIFTTIFCFSQRVSNEKVFFTYPSKIELLYLENPIEYSKTKSFPLAQNGIFVTRIRTKKVVDNSKYEVALNAVEPELNPTDTIQKLFMSLYSSRKKTLISVSEKIDSGFVTFKGPRKDGKTYHDVDLRPLKDNLQVDQLLIISFRYGMNSSYSYGIETFRHCIASIQYQIVNLRDNSFVIREHSEASVPIGEWNTPPDYENIKKGLRKAIDRVISEELEKYN